MKFSKIYLLSTVLFFIAVLPVFAEYGNNPLYRYVGGSSAKYTNNGMSWATAKSNVQDAINELYDYMSLHGIKEGGYVFVAKGNYRPTESTSDDSQLPQFLSFKIYAGVNVWGGWYGDEQVPDNATDEQIFQLIPKVTISGPSGKFVLNQFETVFDGNLGDANDESALAKFVWKEEKQRYNTTFPSNVYHVVTFATNGFYSNNRAKALPSKASINAITVRAGHAYNNDASAVHPYNAYGGGVYMVGNSVMTNSRVSECEASRNGGGVYLDGGGEVNHNIITDCQALGLGIQYGRGGGVCIDQAGLVEQSYMLNNVSREGAGLALQYDETTARAINSSYHTYSAICKSSLIANNTSLNEGGGVYMDGGGVLDGATVTRNRCNGIGALVNGIVSGQSAGVFAVGPARVYNSALWGGQVGENSTSSAYEENFETHESDSYDDLQFAGFTRTGQAKSHLGYVAMNNSDMVNWSYSTTNNIISLATLNAYDASDENVVSLANAGDNRILLGCNDAYLYGKDNQNVAMGSWEKATAKSNAVVAYKIEKIGKIGDTDTYRLRCVTPSGSDYALWGKDVCYLNSQPTAGGATFNLGKDQDIENGSTWKFIEVKEGDKIKGYKIQCVANDAYLDGTTVQTTSEKVWKIYLVDESASQATKKTLNYAYFMRASEKAGVMANLKKSLTDGKTDAEKMALMSGFHPVFSHPKKENGEDYTMLDFVDGLSDGMFYVSAYSFRPQAVSSLAGAGVQLSDLAAEPGVNLTAAELTKDILDIEYSPLCDLGAYNVYKQVTKHNAGTVAFLENPTNDTKATTMTVFVDPNRSSTAVNANVGFSWGEDPISDDPKTEGVNEAYAGSAPYKHLRDALHYVWQYKQRAKQQADSVTSGKLDQANVTYPTYAHYQVLVKEGTIHTAATANNERIGASTIYMIDGVSVYGGFPSELTGTEVYKIYGEGDTLKRNPITYPSIISGNYSDDGYETNVGHLVSFVSVNNAILDGFQLRYGNASGTVGRGLNELVEFDGGAGLVFSNAFYFDGTGINQHTNAASMSPMAGNAVRNCIITGCTARSGAGVYTHVPVASKTISASFENCIFHNNSVIYGNDQTIDDVVTVLKADGSQAYDGSIIRLVNGTNFSFNHCDVIRNVGYGINAEVGSRVTVNNSVFYANLDRALDNTNNFDQVSSGTSGYAKMCSPIVRKVQDESNLAIVSGVNNQFDYLWNADITNADVAAHIYNSVYQYVRLGDGNSAFLTYDSSNDYYPLFKNATKNSGVSVNGDITFFGGATNWMPNSMSPLTNNGSDKTGKDITTVASRNHGGRSDIGAVENDVDQPQNNAGAAESEDGKLYKNFKVYYVRDYGGDLTQGGDGSSWAEAINGNAMYNPNNGQLSSADLGNNLETSSVEKSEMVYSYTLDNFKTEIVKEEPKLATYHLHTTSHVNGKKIYMGQGGQGTSRNLSLEFVFIQTGSNVLYSKTGETMPEYYCYYFVNTTEGSGSTAHSVRKKAGYLVINQNAIDSYNNDPYAFVSVNSSNIAEWNSSKTPTKLILVGEPNGFRIVTEDCYNGDADAKKQGVTIDNHDKLIIGDLSSFEWKYEPGDGNGYSYTLLGHRLKSKDGNKYISKDVEYVKVNNVNYPTAAMTTESSSAEIFKISDYGSWDGTKDVTIKATLTSSGDKDFNLTTITWQTQVLWWKEDHSQDVVKFENKPTAWKVYYNESTYSYYLASVGVSGKYLGYSGSNVTAETDNKKVYWYFEPVYSLTSNGIEGLQYAINCANYYATKANPEKREVWVAEGTYTPRSKHSVIDSYSDGSNTAKVEQPYAYMLKDGANMYGGFPFNNDIVSSPTKAERNPKEYETILRSFAGETDPKTLSDQDAPTVGRVLYQPKEAFTQGTVVDGFTIKHGYLNQAMKININGDVSNLINAAVVFPGLNIGLTGGAGVLIRDSLILENCKITQNACYYNSNKTSLGGSTHVSDNSSHIDGNIGLTDAGDVHIAGGGVANLGGTIKNCEIIGNDLFTYRGYGVHNSNYSASSCSYGAGLYMSSGEIFNTVIAENKISGGCPQNCYNDIQAGAGVYMYGGSFYNNTVVKNVCIPADGATGTSWICAYIPGVFVSDAVTMYNTIIWGNKCYKYDGTDTWDGTASGLSSHAPVENSNNTLIAGFPIACLSGGSNDSPWIVDHTKIKAHYCYVDTIPKIYFKTRGGKTDKQEQIYYNQKGGGNNTLCTNNGFGDPGLDIQTTITVDGKVVTNPSLYRQTQSSINKTVNMGVGTITGVTLPETDAAYEDRIQDCRIDIGAYEYNMASNIVPTVTKLPEGRSYNNVVTFFVNKDGSGNVSASAKDQAACLEKLQRVLDGAGRYKYNHPSDSVVVLIEGYAEEDVLYKPQRTSDPAQASNERSWSIMIPRGVNVYGSFDSNFVNQNIIEHPTRFDGKYQTNSQSQTTSAYHVVTFTDRVFDPDGSPYKSSDTDRVLSGSASSYTTSVSSSDLDDSNFLSMGAKLKENNRANDYSILNGLLIQRGLADGIVSKTSATKSYSGYGGGAVVPSFGSIRNCIIENNSALYGGGGLYLQPGATVCGTLIKGNSAKNGGGVYFEEFDKLPTWTNFSTVGGLSGTVMSLAQVVYSSVVNNEATVKGGGIYFDNNARVVSSVVWGNNCGDQANVAGQTSAFSFASDNEITFAKYPFCYSAVENNRLPGANNISVASQNELGVRFRDNRYFGDYKPTADAAAWDNDDTKFAEGDNGNYTYLDDYYRISNFSALAKTGSSVESFMMAVNYSGATLKDYNGVDRISEGFDYVDIGACAIQQEPRSGADITTILPRLYVARASDVNMQAQQAMITCNDPIYSQMGSSFAYPFQTLDEALEYIRNLRSNTTTIVSGTSKSVADFARNIPFEIVMGKGTFYPTRDIYNVQGESLGNTFLVPEGVTIVGGFDVKELGNTFYGQQYKVNAATSPSFNQTPTETADNALVLMFGNLTDVSSSELVTISSSSSYKIKQETLANMKSKRSHSDNNANNLIEPWEFKYQTILSGKVINDDDAINAYHVITVIADDKLVGALPSGFVYSYWRPVDNENDPDALGYDYEAEDNGVKTYAGKKSYEKGVPVELNGLQISDGQAYRYSLTAANGYVWMDYYHGGGLMVDGNWHRSYKSDGSVKKKYQNEGVNNALAYRNIPVIIDRCSFTNNEGGYGGAISSNSDIYLSNSSFTSNLARAYVDDTVRYSTDGEPLNSSYTNLSGIRDPETHALINGKENLSGICYPGNGGAIYSTKMVMGANCMFENNEAQIEIQGGDDDQEPRNFKSPRSAGSNAVQFGGTGGAVYSGSYGLVQFFNCNFVRNKANMYPCVFARYPNHYKLGVEPTTSETITAQNYIEPSTGAYNKIVGSVFWGNVGTNKKHKFSANLIMASAPLMTETRVQSGAPTTATGAYKLMPEHVTDEDGAMCTHANSAELTAENIAGYQTILDNYAQSLWYCAFEEHTHMTPHRDYDIRLADFSFSKFAERSIREYVYLKFIKKLDNVESGYDINSTTGVKTFKYDGETAYTDFCRTYVHQDYNQIIHSENSHINGPNFTKPSLSAGIAGYTQDADWMPKRINRLTDSGWGYIVQQTQANYPADYEVDSLKNKVNPDGVKYATDASGDYKGNGAFFTVLNSNAKFKNYISMGDVTYMLFDAKSVVDDGTSSKEMRRISKMPTPTVPTFDDLESYAYIDIGVFEFQHQRLGRPVGDVDYIWVAPAEKPENGGAIGTSWLRPTSDIQRAIETLLSNRNGHKKTLYIVEGDYKPFYHLSPAAGSSITSGNSGFTINTENLNSVALSPGRCGAQGEITSSMSIPSFTIMGGFSSEVQTSMEESWVDDKGISTTVNYEVLTNVLQDYSAPEAYRNSESYPTVFYSDNGETHTLLDVVDARQWYGRAGDDSNGSPAPVLSLTGSEDDIKVIPITIDGISFTNTAVSDNPNSASDATTKVGAAINYATIEKFNNPRFSFEVEKMEIVNSQSDRKVLGGKYQVGDKDLITAYKTGVYQYQLGGNTNGWVKLTFNESLQKGETISITCHTSAISGNGVVISLDNSSEFTTLSSKNANDDDILVHEIAENSSLIGANSIYLRCVSGKNIYLTKVNVLSPKREVTVANAPTGAPKLTVTRCKFFNNATASSNIPAVVIAGKGGKSVISNSLFHSNAGTAVVGENVTLANNTIAMNKEGVKLANTYATYTAAEAAEENNPHRITDTNGVQPGADGYITTYPEGYSPKKEGDQKIIGYSDLHNSVLWVNGTTSNSNFSHAEFIGIEPGAHMTYNAVSGLTIVNGAEEDAYHNVSLGSTNHDIMTGPNFEDPENSDVLKRDFHLRPSIRLLNSLKSGQTGSEVNQCGLYYQWTTGGHSYSTDKNTDDLRNAYWNSEKDLSFKSRKVENFIDRGAYEYQDPLLAYVFYNPNVNVSGKGDSWGAAYGFGKLQAAIDMVAVATHNGSAQGYVFAKGGRNRKSTGENIIARNGVIVYGSVPTSFVQEPEKDTRDGANNKITPKSLYRYAVDLIGQRPGVAGPTTDRTIVTGLTSTTNLFSSATILDGLEINNGVVMKPAANSKMILSSSIVNGGSASEVENTLLYNDLFKDNSLTVGTGAYAVNVTSKQAIGGSGTIINSRGDVEPTSILSIDDKQLLDINLEYQLQEGYDSVDNAAEVSADIISKFSYSFTDAFDSNKVYSIASIDYTHDRDLLGNPRKIGSKVDNGAFELWQVASGTAASPSLLTAGYEQNTDANGIMRRKRNYPHEGSFVYLGEYSNFKIDPNVKTVGGASVLPGYVKMHKGSSIYGQGNAIMINKVSVEKLVNVFGETVSMPFDMNYRSNVTLSNGDKEKPRVFTYDGDYRAVRDNNFEKNTGWKEIMGDTTVVPANTGVRLNYSHRPENKATDVPDLVPMWFTSMSKSVVDYIYTEDGNSKTVKLAKHDVYGTTTVEDMGWNCFGSPYLVANFYTNTLADDTYSMHIPHILFEYQYPVDNERVSGTGSFEPLNSWEKYDSNDDGNKDKDPSIILGEGVFTQTATFQDNEELVFKVPTCPVTNAPEYRQIILIHTAESESAVEEIDGVREITIYVKRSELHVEGLTGGERIAVCNPDGRVEVVHFAEQDEHEFVMPITPGAHVVRVDNLSVVVMNLAK